MFALRRVLGLCLLAACEGPTLFVGELEQELDAGRPDAASTDAGRDGRVRDAQGDGRIDFDDLRCKKDEDCRDPRAPHCNTNFYFCTNCQYDRDCRAGEYCDTTAFVWKCRDLPGHKDEPDKAP